MAENSGKSRSRLTGPFLAAIAGTLFGGGVVWVTQAVELRVHALNISYFDLAAVLLTAVAVIVTIFGGVLALAAIWGFQQLKRDAIAAAVSAGSHEVKGQIDQGALKDYIKEQIAALTEEEFSSTRMEDRIKHRVDAVTFGRPDEDRLLNDEEAP